MIKSPDELREKLSSAFDAADIEWRLQWNDEEKAKGWAVPYLTNRAIQSRLDDTVGQDCWKNDFIPWHKDGKGKESQLCGISIYFESRSEWITKWDGAENSDIEAIKGGLSDSMKRAAVQWGIGRYLYGMEPVWVSVEKKGKNFVIAKNERHTLDKAYNKYIAPLSGGQKTGAPVIPLKAEPPSAKPDDEPKELKQQEGAHPEVYLVIKAVTTPTMSGGQNTHIQMQNPNGERMEAYLQGVDSKIVSGAQLTDVTLTKKVKNSLVFYTLDAYKVYAGSKAA